MKLAIGGHSPESLTDGLNAAGVLMNKYAEEYMQALRPFVTIIHKEPDICFVTAAELGLSDGGSLSEIYNAARRKGLSLCPPDTAAYLRLYMKDQTQSADNILSAGRCPDGAITVASPTPACFRGQHRGLYLRNVEGQLWLRGYVCDNEYIWPAGSVFAFAGSLQE